jgi:hypothetical protein
MPCDINDLIKKDSTLQGRLNNWKSNNCTPGNTGCITDPEFACYANSMLDSKRQELDTSLQAIHQPYNSTSASFDANYNATMLTCVVWAMLGTTVLYYAFTKI